MHRVIYDLEATCWDGQSFAAQQEIIEIGAVLLDEFGDKADEFQSFIQPVLAPYLSNYCKKLTGIRQKDVSKAPVFPEVLDKFEHWIPLGQEVIFVSWGKKDPIFFQQDAQLHNCEIHWMDPQLNLKESYRRLKGLRTRVGLKRALKANGIDWEGPAHRAYWDALNLSKLYKKYMTEWPRV